MVASRYLSEATLATSTRTTPLRARARARGAECDAVGTWNTYVQYLGDDCGAFDETGVCADSVNTWCSEDAYGQPALLALDCSVFPNYECGEVIDDEFGAYSTCIYTAWSFVDEDCGDIDEVGQCDGDVISYCLAESYDDVSAGLWSMDCGTEGLECGLHDGLDVYACI